MRWHRAHLALAAALLALGSPAAAQERGKASPAAAREGSEAVEAQHARAVDRVSLPHAARLLGRAEAARGFRLPGYGLVLVLIMLHRALKEKGPDTPVSFPNTAYFLPVINGR